jgi:transposase
MIAAIAEFVKRPGLSALLAVMRQRPCHVQPLVTMEVSRLGREQTEAAVVVREMLRAGVRLFTYGDRLRTWTRLAPPTRPTATTRRRAAMSMRARFVLSLPLLVGLLSIGR